MTTFPNQSSYLLGVGGLVLPGLTSWVGGDQETATVGKDLGRPLRLGNGPGHSVPQGANQFTPSKTPTLDSSCPDSWPSSAHHDPAHRSDTES